MAFILTPRALSVRSELYHQIGSMLSAGLPVPKVFEALHQNPPARSLRPVLKRIIAGLAEGNTLTGALRDSGSWMSSFDIALIEAGETSGRLDACFKLLAVYYKGRAELARQVISDLMYPLFVVHVGILLAPLPQLVLKGNLNAYLLQTFGVLIPAYAVIVMLIIACQGQRGDLWRSMVEQLLGFVPILGKARRHLALARLSVALEALISAGVSIFNAWEMAAAASGSPALKREIMSWRPELESGRKTPSDFLSESGEFPEMFANLYHSGQLSGKQDDTLRRLAEYYQEDGTRKLRALAKWMPQLVFLGIAIAVGYQVVSFYSAYFKGIGDAANF